jgi:SMC interacting uncharacterized protein involved in chromosome segregation
MHTSYDMQLVNVLPHTNSAQHGELKLKPDCCHGWLLCFNVLHCAVLSQEAELQSQITSLEQQLQDQRDKAAAAAARQARTHEQQLQELQEKLQAAVSRAAVQHAEDVEAAGQLRARLQETDSQLAVMRAERDALQVRGLGNVKQWSR